MKCGDKEWQHCRVEKMGCTGCHYDEIEANEYVRTESGNIFVVDEEKKVLQGLKFLDVQYGNIVKHGKTMKDLMKIGDILKYRINNLAQVKIDEIKEYRDARNGKKYLGVKGFGLDQIEILEFLTKELFTSNCFSVEV